MPTSFYRHRQHQTGVARNIEIDGVGFQCSDRTKLSVHVIVCPLAICY